MNQNQLPQTPIPAELAASRDDFELFRRLLRVARLLNADNFDDLLNQTTQSSASFASPFALQNTPQDVGLLGLLDPALRGLRTQNPGSRPVTAGARSKDGDFDYDEHGFSPNGNNDNDEEEDEDEYALSPRTPKRKRTNSTQNRTRRLRSHQPATPSEAPAQPEPQDQAAEQEGEPDQERPHAAVEKRYRAMVNAKIQQLHEVIPTSNTFSIDASVETGGEQGQTTEKMPTKSVVLDRAIQYLNHLITTYEAYENEGNTLKTKLQSWLEISAVESDSNTAS
ncbi:hypothetical protein BDW74DRAFT_177227 [Aspergillus multicolor]|uniref:basic helix-loop-helix domain-containing protein n=1 Tax=Aspergillus multicolor TaxID=41759 RepID=UPI003CCD6B73